MGPGAGRHDRHHRRPTAGAGRALRPEVKPQGTLSAEIRATGPVAKPEIKATLNGTGLGAGADWASGLPAADPARRGQPGR